MNPVDEIALSGLTAFGRHGVYAHERENGQQFSVDLRLYLPLAEAGASDDVTRTVHYGELADRVVAVITGEPVNLIETLAERIADVALADERVQFVSVTVHKPQAPISHTFADVSVTVHRGRSESR